MTRLPLRATALFCVCKRGSARAANCLAIDQYLFFAIFIFMRWTVEIFNRAVAAEIAALPDDMRARLSRLVHLIQDIGFQALPRDSVKHLDGKLWELRITGRDGISRAIYITASGQRAVVLRVFVKKTDKTPRRELEIARQRAKEVR